MHTIFICVWVYFVFHKNNGYNTIKNKERMGMEEWKVPKKIFIFSTNKMLTKRNLSEWELCEENKDRKTCSLL